MTGRAVDQLFPVASDPELREPWIADARDYVRLAERASGRISTPVSHEYVWGDALEELSMAEPDYRIVNLETSITTSNAFWRGKDVHYRMHPANVGCLKAAAIDCCVLANNHAMDFDREGLAETLAVLGSAGIAVAGAGSCSSLAEAPAVLGPRGHRALVFAWGHESAGVHWSWGARERLTGINYLSSFDDDALAAASECRERHSERGDIAIASLHWGGNWGYEIPEERVVFARRLIDEAGYDVVHGHSSHHALAIEVHNGRLILHGCGDLVSDYEGIAGHEELCPDIALMYFADVDRDGRLTNLSMSAMRSRRLRLERAESSRLERIAEALTLAGARFGTAVGIDRDGKLHLAWKGGPG